MKRIKNFEEYDKIDESVIGTICIIIGAFKILRMFISYAHTRGTEDVELMRELKELTGVDVTINVFTAKSKKDPPAYASPNKVFIEQKLKEHLTHRELIAVLLHEVSHIKSKDGIKKEILKLLNLAPAFVLNSWLLYFLTPFFSNILYNTISRNI